MTVKSLPFNELKEQVLVQLKDQGYMKSTLTIYRRTYNRVHTFINQRGTDYYTKELGKEFLCNTCVSKETLTSYICAIRRLDDYIEGKPYRCHHDNPSEKVTEVYSSVLDEYLNSCRFSGNAPSTVSAKEKTCISFLNYLEQAGCNHLSDLDTCLVSRALLQYSNKDNYARVRMFLKYLFEKELITTDLSAIVPRYKRRKVLPTTYTPDEILKVEASIDVDTITGIRNLAIIRLATRMGLRSGDIARLKWSEIDFISGNIMIIQEKTGVPLSLQMPQEVSDALILHLENIADIPKDGFVFHSLSAPYGRITTSIIRHAVNTAFVDAGIDIKGKKHGPHTFRSSLASSMVNDRVSYDTVRRILGHSDPDVIRHYARADIENLRLCSIEPPAPSGLFKDYLSGKKVIDHV